MIEVDLMGPFEPSECDIPALILAHFSFLTSEHGFSASKLGANQIRFSGNRAVFEIGVGDRGEPSVSVSQSAEGIDYPFELYLSAFHSDQVSQLGDTILASRLEIEARLATLARLLRFFGKPLIEGNSEVFQTLAKRAEETLQ